MIEQADDALDYLTRDDLDPGEDVIQVDSATNDITVPPVAVVEQASGLPLDTVVTTETRSSEQGASHAAPIIAADKLDHPENMPDPNEGLPDVIFTMEHMPSEDQSDLSLEQKQQFLDMLNSDTSMFARGKFDHGHVADVEHIIDLTEAKPIYQRPYAMSIKNRDDSRTYLGQMIAARFIRRSQGSPWSSPVVIVTKKDGASKRYCVVIAASMR